jgi:multicomponent Na+:H+ antiporter subunit G
MTPETLTPDSIMDIAGAVVLTLGALFSLAAGLGLVRFPDPVTRMHAATKPAVFGLLLVLAGVALVLRDPTVTTLLTVAVMMQLLTAPVSGHLISRNAHRSGDWDPDGTHIDELAEDEASGDV